MRCVGVVEQHLDDRGNQGDDRGPIAGDEFDEPRRFRHRVDGDRHPVVEGLKPTPMAWNSGMTVSMRSSEV
ncbi:MAG: hypothetical protein JWR11_1915 [Mycobacterium sp.]|nr:hypothetical protein [Mycobacterium sp.]